MNRIVRIARAAGVAALLAAVTPAAAQAQLGKWVKQKVAEKAAGKAVESVLGPGEPAGGGGAAAGGQADPFAKGKVIPITAEVVDRFVAAYSKEKAEERRRTDIATYFDCTVSEEFDQERLSALTDERYRATAELDSAKVRSVDARIAQLRAGKCGQVPADWDEDNANGPFERAGAVAGGFAYKDYLVLRERMEAFYYLSRKERAENYRQYVFSDGERAALEARKGELLELIRKAVSGEG